MEADFLQPFDFRRIADFGERFQARAAGVVNGGLTELRALVASGSELVRYEPVEARIVQSSSRSSTGPH